MAFYKLPVRISDVLEIYRDTSLSHTEALAEAVDFLFVRDDGDFSVEGLPIYAAADGEVAWTKSDSQKGGPDRQYWFDGNWISVKHGLNEYTHYEHLQHGGVLVKEGEAVRAGQLIGLSGNTGYTLLSHLHFERFQFDGAGSRQSLPVRFRDLNI